jgi:hypothetical protein
VNNTISGEHERADWLSGLLSGAGRLDLLKREWLKLHRLMLRPFTLPSTSTVYQDSTVHLPVQNSYNAVIKRRQC